MTASSEKSFHEYSLRVEFEDCDMMGIVYHPNYFNYFERARSRAIAERGIAFRDWMKDGIGLAIAKLECSFNRPARLYDDLYIYTTWEKPSSKVIKLKQYIAFEKILDGDFEKNPKVGTNADILLVCVSLQDGKSVAIPEKYRSKLT
jgi:acyl-CoA thioester hydrolase